MVVSSRYKTTEERYFSPMQSAARRQREVSMDRCGLSCSSQWWVCPSVYFVGTACTTTANCGAVGFEE